MTAWTGGGVEVSTFESFDGVPVFMFHAPGDGYTVASVEGKDAALAVLRQMIVALEGWEP